MMSYNTWVLLDKPKLKSAPRQVSIAKDIIGDCLGVAKASLNVNSYLMTADFYVMDPRNLQE